MVKFITIAKNKEVNNSFENIINVVMMKLDLYYEVNKYEDDKFKEKCKNNCGTNIFIIEDSEDISAERIVKMIKKEYKMVAAFIVIVGKEEESRLEKLVFDHSFLIDVIKDNEDLDINLENDIKRILDILDARKQVLNVINDKLLYRISYSDIYYIEKELKSKKSIIITKYGKFHLFKSLNELEEELDNRFFRSHQSAIVNLDNVERIDFENNVIIFNNDFTCSLLSRSAKKILKKMVFKQIENNIKVVKYSKIL